MGVRGWSAGLESAGDAQERQEERWAGAPLHARDACVAHLAAAACLPLCSVRRSQAYARAPPPTPHPPTWLYMKRP